MAWDQKPSATKTDCTLARTYFENIIKATNTYEQNAGSKPQRYDSANQLADLGNEIKGYIQQVASNNTTRGAANVHTKEKLAIMEAEIRKLAEAMTVLTAAMNKENNIPNPDANNPQKKAFIPHKDRLPAM